MSHYALEGPIEAAKDDLLNRAEQVKPMAALLLGKSKSGFVVSIEGPWGCGKTSVLHLLKEQLQAQGLDGSSIVHFSPWLVTDAGTMAGEFLKQLMATLAMPQLPTIMGSAEKKIEIARKVLKYARYLPIGGVREDLANLEEALGAAGDVVSSAKPEVPDLSGRRRAVVEALADLDSPIVVIIDDVDRLAPKDVYEVIRLVRAVGEFPNVRYVLAMDAGYVEQALQKSQIPQHESYLDKIFHHRFVIPPTFASDLRPLLLGRLRQMAKTEAGLAAQWLPFEERLGELIGSGLGAVLTSLRDVKLVANRVGLMKDLFGEVNLADVVALEALAVKAPGVYRHVLQQPVAYTGAAADDDRPDFVSAEVWDKHRTDRSRALESVPVESRAAVATLCAMLFPIPRLSERDRTTVLDWADAVLGGRLCAPSRLRIAISRTKPDAGVTVSGVRRFVHDPGSRGAIRQTVEACQGQRRFLWLLQAELKAASTEPAEPRQLLQELGLLLDDPAAQQAGYQEDISLFATASLKRLRSMAQCGGQPVLTGRFGLHLAYLEATGWYSEPRAWRDDLDPSVHIQPEDAVEAIAWRQNQSHEMLSLWRSYVDHLAAEGAPACDRDLLRDVYELCDQLAAHAARAERPGSELPAQVSAAIHVGMDRRGRRYVYRKAVPLAAADSPSTFALDLNPDLSESELVALEGRADFTAFERACLRAYQQPGERILVGGLGGVDSMDLYEGASSSAMSLAPAY